MFRTTSPVKHIARLVAKFQVSDEYSDNFTPLVALRPAATLTLAVILGRFPIDAIPPPPPLSVLLVHPQTKNAAMAMHRCLIISPCKNGGKNIITAKTVLVTCNLSVSTWPTLLVWSIKRSTTISRANFSPWSKWFLVSSPSEGNSNHRPNPQPQPYPNQKRSTLT